MQIRKHPWAIVALFLIAFCWLGSAAVSFRALFQGLETKLPAAARFAAPYGPIEFSIFGIISIAAAVAVLVSHVWARHRWAQWVLIGFFALLIFWAIRGLSSIHG